MKKTIIILIVLAAIFTTCKKEDRDEIFESRTHRYLTGSWRVNKIIINSIDSTNYLINNDSLCYAWQFSYTGQSYDPLVRRPFWFYFNNNGYNKGTWALQKNNKELYISAGVKNSNDTNIVNRWFFKGFWEIKNINKNEMKLMFNKYNIEYEYSFYKYSDE